jgi:hypothetical protein
VGDEKQDGNRLPSSRMPGEAHARYKTIFKRAKKSLSPYYVTVIFLAIAAILGSIGWIILPTSASPSVAGGMSIRIFSPNRFSAQRVSITFMDIVVDNTGATGSVRISFLTQPVKAGAVLELGLLVPSGADMGDNCTFLAYGQNGVDRKYNRSSGIPFSDKDAPDPRNYGACFRSGQGMQIAVPVKYDPVGSSYGADVWVSVGGQPSSYEQQDNQIAAVMPHVVNAPASAEVDVEYAVDGSSQSYAWQGRQPDDVEQADRSNPEYMLWRLSNAERSGGPLAANATNPSAQAVDSIRLFLAGAVVAVAGGALIAALQEFLDVRRKKREEQSQARAAVTGS